MYKTKKRVAPEPRTYRPRRIAEMYDVAPQTVYAWIAEGRLKAYRVGRTILVPVEEVERVFGFKKATADDAT